MLVVSVDCYFPVTWFIKEGLREQLGIVQLLVLYLELFFLYQSLSDLRLFVVCYFQHYDFILVHQAERGFLLEAVVPLVYITRCLVNFFLLSDHVI